MVTLINLYIALSKIIKREKTENVLQPYLNLVNLLIFRRSFW